MPGIDGYQTLDLLNKKRKSHFIFRDILKSMMPGKGGAEAPPLKYMLDA